MVDLLGSPIKTIHNLENGYDFVKDHTEWRWFIFPEMIWKFKLNREAPLVIELEDGVKIMPNYEFNTNLGSIPLPFRPLYPKDEFPVCYALHDDEYNRHGVYVKFPGELFFEFYPTDREGADMRLKRNIRTIGEGSKSRAATIHRAVRLGGGLPWAMGKVREKGSC